MAIRSRIEDNERTRFVKFLCHLSRVHNIQSTPDEDEIVDYNILEVTTFGSPRKFLVELTSEKLGTIDGIVNKVSFYIQENEYEKAKNLMPKNGFNNSQENRNNEKKNTITARSVPKMTQDSRVSFTDILPCADTYAWWAYHCECSDTYFCMHTRPSTLAVHNTPTLLGILKNDRKMILCLPVFFSVLFPICIEKREIPDWEGNLQEKLLFSMGKFEQFTDFTGPNLLNMAIHLTSSLENSIFEKDGIRYVEYVKGVIKSGRTDVCNDPNHNYGSSVKFIAWLNEGREHPPPLETRMVGAAFCFQQFGLCYPCYQDRTPAFSLINL